MLSTVLRSPSGELWMIVITFPAGLAGCLEPKRGSTFLALHRSDCAHVLRFPSLSFSAFMVKLISLDTPFNYSWGCNAHARSFPMCEKIISKIQTQILLAESSLSWGPGKPQNTTIIITIIIDNNNMHVHRSFLLRYYIYTELQILEESIFFFLEVLVSHIIQQ